jgi:hypothetical protein
MVAAWGWQDERNHKVALNRALCEIPDALVRRGNESAPARIERTGVAFGKVRLSHERPLLKWTAICCYRTCE